MILDVRIGMPWCEKHGQANMVWRDGEPTCLIYGPGSTPLVCQFRLVLTVPHAALSFYSSNTIVPLRSGWDWTHMPKECYGYGVMGWW